MQYTITTQYTDTPRFTPLPGNDKLSIKETFTATRGTRSQLITYCHAAFETKRNPVYEPKYATFFNEFLNINDRFIPEGSVALDIGAYDGDTTLPIAFLCGPTGKTYAFECGEAFMSQFSVNAGLNPSLNIEGIPAALMPTSGIHEFLYCSTDYNGGAPSTNSWVGSYTVPRLVRAVSFDDFARGKDLTKLAFIKVDTEGHDFHILWSFRDVIAARRPVIHAEWFPRTEGYMQEVLGYLRYSLFCGFTLEPLILGRCEWRQDVVMVPTEKVASFGLKQP